MHREEVSLATQVQTGAIKSTVSFFACARLGVLAAIGVVAASESLETSLAVLLLLAMPISALLLWSWQYVSNAVLNGRLFPVVDALVAGLLCLLSVVRLDTPALGGSYFLLSVVLIGITRSFPWVVSWFTVAGTVVLLGCGKTFIYGHGLRLVLFLFFIGMTAVLALRMGYQFQQTGHLTEELAEARVQRAASEERLLIARDLHDSVAKSVHGIRMLAEALRDDLDESDLSVARRLAETLFEAADEASREARAVLDGLNSSGKIQELGAHLCRQIRAWGKRTGHNIVIDVPVDLQVQRPHGEWAWNVERVLGELLSNVDKHAEAGGVHVTMSCHDETVTVVVEDDGKGPQEAMRDQEDLVLEGHYGLAGMRERLRKLGGELRIGRCEKGAGTSATIIVPLPGMK
jgi:GAF sensor signal transduction histidine kinase